MIHNPLKVWSTFLSTEGKAASIHFFTDGPSAKNAFLLYYFKITKPG